MLWKIINVVFFQFLPGEDDIDLEDTEEKPKDQSMFATLNKQKLSNSFKALKG